MCDYCKTTDIIISEGIITSTGRIVFADLRLERENNELDINYGLLDEQNHQCNDTTWSKSLKIKYCPFCGRELD